MGLKGKPKFSQRQWHIKTTHCKEHMGTRERNKRLVRPGGFGGGDPPQQQRNRKGEEERRGEKGERGRREAERRVHAAFVRKYYTRQQFSSFRPLFF